MYINITFLEVENWWFRAQGLGESSRGVNWARVEIYDV